MQELLGASSAVWFSKRYAAVTIGNLNIDEGLCVKCGCRERTCSRDELVRLLGEDASMENIGLRFRCSRCNEKPSHVWVTWSW